MAQTARGGLGRRGCRGDAGVHRVRARGPAGDRPAWVHAAGAGPSPLALDVGLGLLLGIYLLEQVTAYPVGALPQAHCIDYTTHTPNDVLIGALYVIVTCGPALISSRPYLRRFGLVSLAGVIAVALVRVNELTSLWCLYVAVVSLLILEHFRRQRAL